jgi:hypothetical protein
LALRSKGHFYVLAALLDDFPGAEGLPGTFVEGVLPESFRLALDKMAALAMALQGNID